MAKVISDSEKVARYHAFWGRAETDRPLIGTTINPLPSIRAVRGEGKLKPEDLDIEENLQELDEEWEQWREASGDAVWSASPLWAFHWMTAIAGCPNERRGDTVWIKSVLEDWSHLSMVRFARGNPWFQRLIEFIHALVEHAAGRYPVAAPSLAVNADLLMHLRGTERLALDLYDSPEMVAALGERCVKLCASAIESVYEVIPPYLGGYAGTIRYFWAPGKIVEMGEDLSIMMSPAMHQRFVVPIHRAMASRFPYNILHIHSANLHTVPNVLDIEEVTAIEITPDFGADMLPHIPLMAQILERKPLIIHGVMTVAAIKEIIRVLPARGLCVFCRCDSASEGAAILDSLL